MTKLWLATALLLINFVAYSQTDTEFWFAPPDISSTTYNGGSFDRPIHLKLTAGNVAAIVRVSVPANPSFTPVILNVAAGATSTLDLTTWIDLLETRPANQKLNTGLFIKSDNPIAVYYEVVSSACDYCNPDIFVLKGGNALGQDFYVPLQNFSENNRANNYNPAPTNSFDIVATEDNTIVTITPSKDIIGHAAGASFTITLNKGQTYSATATGFRGLDHLTGSRVTADKPVAITMKDDLVSNPAYGLCADMGGDQIIPVSKIGTTYIAIQGFLTSPYDKLFIIATQNNTSVNINGNIASTLNAGETYMHTLSAATAYITSSAPVYVSQLTGVGCEISLANLPPIGCTGSQKVAFSRTSPDEFYLNLLVPAGAQGSFLINGSSSVITAADFNPVPSTGGQWLYARKNMTSGPVLGGAVLVIENSQALFHAGIINGDQRWGSRFGFFSDFNPFKVTAQKATYCTGSPVALKALTASVATFAWTGPNGFTSTQQNPIVTTSGLPIHSGKYYVRATFNGCSAIDSLDVTINDASPINLPDTIRQCASSIVIDAGSGFSSYNWSNGATTSAISVTSSGKYYVTVTNGSGCSNVDSVYADINSVNLSVVSDSQPICAGKPILVNALAVNGATYAWTGPNNFTSSQQNPVIATAGLPTHSGKYYVTASFNNCSDLDSVEVSVKDLPVTNLADTIRQCTSPALIDAGPGFSSYSWSNGATNQTISVNTTGEYYVTITDNFGCINRDTVYADIRSMQVAITANNQPLCIGATRQLSASPASTYQWYKDNSLLANETGAQLTISQAGTYSLHAFNDIGCEATAQLSITAHQKPYLNGVSAKTICVGEEASLQILNGDSFQWSPGTYLNNTSIPNPVAKPAVTTIYSVHVTDAICNYDTTITTTVNVNEGPVLSLSKSNDIDCSHDLTKLNASGALQYIWTPSAGLSDATIANPTVSNIASDMIYTVEGIDQNGCKNTGSITVKVSGLGGKPSLMVPSAFTPNNDGKNDCFGIPSFFSFQSIELSVYNRWGKRIFITRNSTDCWDGTYNGVSQDSGVFVYIIKGKSICGDIFIKGLVTLIR